MGATEQVDVKSVPFEVIEKALIAQCKRLGSKPYYYSDEISRAKENLACVILYRDLDTGELFAYTSPK